MKFQEKCSVCGLDYGRYNVGDGPAAFLTLIIGALLIAAALTLDAALRPPLWVHIVLWVPLTAAAVIYGLRVGKGALLASEHQRQAAEGREVENMTEPAQQSIRRWPLIPTILVLAAVAAMIALGVWQLQRKSEKEALIALFQRNMAMSSLVAYPELPPVPDTFLYRKSSVVCLEPVRWDPRSGTDRKGKSGIRMIADCRTGAEGPGVLVDVGIGDDFAPPKWTGGTVQGTIVPGPEQPTVMERAMGKATPARAMLIADQPLAGLRASAVPSADDTPNNHLAYAFQWFFFAIVALIIYILAVRRRLQP